jgi:hypothetical protein
MMWSQEWVPAPNPDLLGDEEARGAPLESRRKKSENPPGELSEVERMKSICRRPKAWRFSVLVASGTLGRNPVGLPQMFTALGS